VTHVVLSNEEYVPGPQVLVGNSMFFPSCVRSTGTEISLASIPELASCRLIFSLVTADTTDFALSDATSAIVSTSMLVSIARRRNSTFFSVIFPIDKSDTGTDKAIDMPVM
jgi:hypothetical protein